MMISAPTTMYVRLGTLVGLCLFYIVSFQIQDFNSLFPFPTVSITSSSSSRQDNHHNDGVFVTVDNNSSTISFGDLNSSGKNLASVLLDFNISSNDAPSIVLPPPKLVKTLQIYNMIAWTKLNELVRGHGEHRSRNYSITFNGGSSTAGGGLKQRSHLYTKRVVQSLLLEQQQRRQKREKYHTSPSSKDNDKNGINDDEKNLTIDVNQRGHGTRNSLHSALLLRSFVPPGCDVLTWEFAINDYGYTLKNDHVRRTEIQNQFIFWLDQVQQLKPHPPLVVIVYLWKRPFKYNSNGIVDNPVFDVHEEIAKHYDFVVGHVNLASYIDELQLPYDVANKVFLADPHHPNALGHAVLSLLLLELFYTGSSSVSNQDMTNATLISSNQTMKDISNTTTTTTTAKPTFEWACGSETRNKKLMIDTILPKRNQSPQPLASFTFALPRNTEVFPGMLDVSLSLPTASISSELMGKASEHREDRIMSSTVPCCHSNITMDFVSPTPINGNVQLLWLGYGQTQGPKGPVQIFIGNNETTTRAATIRSIIESQGWDCLWNFDGQYAPRFAALEQPWESVSKVSICSLDSCCKKEQTAPQPNSSSTEGGCTKLLSMVLF